MKSCFPVNVVDADYYGLVIPDNYQWLELAGEGLKCVDRVVKKYGLDAGSIMVFLEQQLHRLDIPVPWAVILFKSDYPIVQYFKILQGFLAFRHVSYHEIRENKPNTRYLGIVLVFNKNDLQTLAERSLLMKSAWENLADKAEDQHWLCISDPVPAGWLKEHRNPSPRFSRLPILHQIRLLNGMLEELKSILSTMDSIPY